MFKHLGMYIVCIVMLKAHSMLIKMDTCVGQLSSYQLCLYVATSQQVRGGLL